jgi:uncharacterized protein (TIGR02646 family)
MRYLPRIPLPPLVLSALESYQSALDIAVEAERDKDAPKVAERIEAVWKGRRSNKSLKAVEQALRAMASGIERCMYCEDNHGCDIEHGYPKVRYPSRALLWLNLLWVCATCNRQKNNAFEEEMLDPTQDDPLDHLVFSFATGRYTPRDDSRRGEATLRVVRRIASDQTLTRGRQKAIAKLRIFLRDYDTHQAEGRAAEADAIRGVVVQEPFSAAFAAVLRASAEPGATEVLGEELVAVVSRHPAMHRWLREADAARAEAVKQELDELAKAVRIRQAGGLLDP